MSTRPDHPKQFSENALNVPASPVPVLIDWRFSAEERMNAGFILDEPRYAGASIL